MTQINDHGAIYGLLHLTASLLQVRIFDQVATSACFRLIVISDNIIQDLGGVLAS